MLSRAGCNIINTGATAALLASQLKWQGPRAPEKGLGCGETALRMLSRARDKVRVASAGVLSLSPSLSLSLSRDQEPNRRFFFC